MDGCECRVYLWLWVWFVVVSVGVQLGSCAVLKLGVVRSLGLD